MTEHLLSLPYIVMYVIGFFFLIVMWIALDMYKRLQSQKKELDVNQIKNEVTLKNLGTSLHQEELKAHVSHAVDSSFQAPPPPTRDSEALLDEFEQLKPTKADTKQLAQLKARLLKEFEAEQKAQQNYFLEQQKTAQKAALDKVMNNKSGYQELKPYLALTHKKSKLSTRYWKDWFNNKFYPNKVVLINMELLNGFHAQFLAKEKDGAFYYKKKVYVMDNEKKYYIIDSKIWAYDYHEEFTNPIQRKLPISDIKETLESSGISEIEYATSPKTLERFIISKVAEGIMRGQALDEALKQLRLLVIIGTVAGVGHFVYILFKTGAFAAVNIPGVTS